MVRAEQQRLYVLVDGGRIEGRCDVVATDLKEQEANFGAYERVSGTKVAAG